MVPCTSKELPQKLVGDASAYYGQAVLTTAGTGTYKAHSGFGKWLRDYFGIAGKFNAVVSVELWKGGALLYQRPLFTASVDTSNGTTISANNVLASETEVSPYFLLDTNTGALQAKINISVVNKQSGALVETLKKGIDTGVALGGHGWLVTAISNDLFYGEAARAESTFHKYYSYSIAIGSETDLGFGDNAYKSIKYTVSLPGPKKKDPPATVEATIALRTTTSLVVLKARIAGTTLPDTNKGAETVESWASRIGLGKDRTLASYLKEGTPRTLEDLAVREGETPATEIKRLQQIESACESLKKAIAEAPVRLSDSDKLLILFDELRRAKVFRVYKASELACTSGFVADWEEYGIKPPLPPAKATLAVPDDAKNHRLELLATYWKLPDGPARATTLPKNFAARVALTARPDFLPGFPSSAPVDASGYATWDIDPRHLALLEAACLGNWKPTPPGEPWATSFATFKGSESVLYLLKVYFVDDAPWGGEGPAIKAISIMPATDQDKVAFKQTTSCFPS